MNTEKQLTAVKWLNEMLRDNHKEVFDGNIWEQAKSMEKKQIENAFNQGFATPQWDKEKENKAKQYYEKTFKSE